MGSRHNFSNVEEGKWESYSNETKKSELTLKVSLIVYKAFLILLSLAGLVVYATSAGAISCRMLDKMVRRENCPVTVKPFASLWQASIYTMLIVNGAAAAVFIQCLMMTFRLDKTQSAWPGMKQEKLNIFNTCEMELCNVHSSDYILKLTYRTRCCDDVVIRAQFPVLNYSFSDRPRGSQSQMRNTQQYVLRESELLSSMMTDLRNSLRQSQSVDQEITQQIPMVVTDGSVQILAAPAWKKVSTIVD